MRKGIVMAIFLPGIRRYCHLLRGWKPYRSTCRVAQEAVNATTNRIYFSLKNVTMHVGIDERDKC